MKYLFWNEKKITDFSEKNIEALYNDGYVFTRLDHGTMQQTRSLRLDLNQFELTSENRRIIKKVPGLEVETVRLPLDSTSYDYATGKIAKDFYAKKFGAGIMSAQKIKMMLTDSKQSNFNLLLKFNQTGFAICHTTPSLIHYSYPFYDLSSAPKDMGLAMMITTAEYAKKSGHQYLYLGSLQRPTDIYKLQFSGLEWFDGKVWNNNMSEAKKILSELN